MIEIVKKFVSRGHLGFILFFILNQFVKHGVRKSNVEWQYSLMVVIFIIVTLLEPLFKYVLSGEKTRSDKLKKIKNGKIVDCGFLFHAGFTYYFLFVNSSIWSSSCADLLSPQSSDYILTNYVLRFILIVGVPILCVIGAYIPSLIPQKYFPTIIKF